MKRIFSRAALLLLTLTITLCLSACKGDEANGDVTPEPPALPTTSGAQPTGTQTPAPTAPASDLEDAVRNYWSEDQLTQSWGPNQVVEHLFFHPLISYPEYTFSSAIPLVRQQGLDDWMVTVGEYNEILQNLYEKDYILVHMSDVWSEETTATGEVRMVRNTLMLPEGKKPLVFSYDDVNYYDYMLVEGFTHKLIMGEDGDLWSWGLDPVTGAEVVTQDLDALTVLDKFVREHPDFSLNGAKGCLSLTGYQGILGYRTQNDIDIAATDPARPAFDQKRQAEIDAVTPIIARLKDTGWTFGSHTWGHIRLDKPGEESFARIKRDTLRWAEEVGTLVGPTNILFYPHGSRPDGNDVNETGAVFRFLHDQGFRVFASVGINSYSKLKTDISAVICDRLHPDGTTLRMQRSKYLQFYDAKDVIDLTLRPDLPYDFSK